jgi:hypothetical protein
MVAERSPCYRGLAVLSLLLTATTGCSSDDKGLTTPRPGSGGSSGPVATGGTTSSGSSDGASDAAIEIRSDSGPLGGTAGTGGVAAYGGATGKGGAAGGSTGKGGTTGRTTGSGGAIGGTTGPGVTVSTGGTAGAGGVPRDAGIPPSTGGGGGGVDAASNATCSFDVTTELSPKIATVGIVTWSTSLAKLKSAHIDFGLATDYGMTAPVDLQAPGHRTLLLGLKQEKTYHYRIVASDGSAECGSDDRTLTTGKLMTGLPKITLSTKSTAAPIFGGFLLTGPYVLHEGTKTPGYILDADGEHVWAYAATMGDVLCMRMSYAGTHMWFSESNVPNGMVRVRRVTMDGATDEDLSSSFVGQHLGLTVLSDETVAFAAYGANGCDDIKEYAPDGTVRTVVNAGAAQGLSGKCDVVDVQHSKDDDALVFSDQANRSLVKVRRQDGTTLWVLNGSRATLTGDTWPGYPSGLHVLGPDRVLLFATNDERLGGSGDGSSAIEMSINLSGKTASKVWSYQASETGILGDVQRLPGGNTIIAHSLEGVLREVDASGTLLQEWTWPIGGSYGYIEKRATLYGAPIR